MIDLVSELERITGTRDVVVGADLRARAASSMNVESHRAIALVRPQSTEELSEIMALCNKRGQAVVIQGGLTGLVDGALAGADELAISLERMNKIESVDAAGRTITAMAGATIQTVQRAASEHDLLFGVDWGARGSATIGGSISANAGGNAVLRYGMMREQVLGLEVVLADGTVMSMMNSLIKNNTGYDLKHLFIGSEGTLGIVTRAVLRLRPTPRSVQTALIAADDFSDVVALLGSLDAGLAGGLSAFEVMWQEHYEMIVKEGGHRRVLPDGYPYYVVIEATGSNAEADAVKFEAALGDAMEAKIIVDAALCSSTSQRQKVWKIREDVDTFMRVLDPPIPFDVSVPIRDMEEYVSKVYADMKSTFPRARGTVFGHLGDNNLHFCWTVGSNAPETVEAVSKVIYSKLTPYVGSVSAEHGIGLAKRKYLKYSRSCEEIEWMKRLKQVFDPDDLLNPGRIFDANCCE
ncbi:MAG: FAD-binding oxidoreductase [Gammaproteobacteria bacterium]|nr:FAD-binding oxidoreductase [Gammaproteobacteria bacterium]